MVIPTRVLETAIRVTDFIANEAHIRKIFDIIEPPRVFLALCISTL